MRQATHLFWCDGYVNHDKHDSVAGKWWADFGSRLTPLNLANVRSVHFVLPLYTMDTFFAAGNSIHQGVRLLQPKILKVTNRNGDWPSMNSRSPSDAIPLNQRRIMRGIALLLDACATYVEKFQLALEIYDREPEVKNHATFFDSVRYLEKRIGITRAPGDGVYFESHLRVVNEPLVTKWYRRCKPFPPGETSVFPPGHTLHVHELEWVHVRRAIDPSIGGHFGIPDDPAPNNPFIPRQVRRKPRGRVGNGDLDPFLHRQDLLRQHSQKLSDAFTARWRKGFNKMREKADLRDELERISALGSLLYIKD
jgi:hypothetical protein